MFRTLLLGTAATLAVATAAQAADLIIPTTPQPIYEAAGFDWNGFYIGARVGGEFVDSEDTIIIPVDASGLVIGGSENTTSGVIGAVVGVNFVVADPILLGLEVTADYVKNGEGEIHTGEFFVNARVGAILTDSVLVYAIGGVGVSTTGDSDDDAVGILATSDNNVGLFQLGAGVELAVTDAITVRGEVVGIGTFDDDDDGEVSVSAVGEDDAFFDAAKATVGIFYHF